MARRFLVSALCSLAPMVLAPACARDATPPERIVLILVDTLRRDHLGIYGGDTPTPHMDGIGRSGTVFRNAVSSFHATPMSMGALFTGHTPSLESGRGDDSLRWNQDTWCGLSRFADPEGDACLPDALTSLGEAMRELSYEVLGVTANPLLHRPAGFDRGFSSWREIKSARPLAFSHRTKPRFAAQRAGDVVNAAVREVLEGRRSDRFFLYVHYLDVHDWHLARSRYARSVADADRHVGELLALLEAEGLREGAAVILTSDHGESLGEEHFRPPTRNHKGNPSFETVLRVPLLASGFDPGIPPDALIRSEDVFRMLVRVAGGEPAARSDLGDDELFVSEHEFRTYRRGRWKSFWRRGGEGPHLLDLAEDPGERRDVAAEHGDVVEAHRRRIAELGRRMATGHGVADGLHPEQEEHLRVLGYLEAPEEE